MTPKEKAKELVDKIINISPMEIPLWMAKDIALIAVDEILEAIDWHDFETPNEELKYWEEVKQEIEVYEYRLKRYL